MSTQPEGLLLELLRATALGDQIAFAELYRITSAKLYAIASRMLRRADTASDALQEAYVRIWTQSGDYDVDKGQPIHWMAAIVRHVCVDMLRRTASQPLPSPDLQEIEEVVPPHDIVSVDIDRCLRRLDATQSKAILMAFYFGLSHAELAQVFAVPLGTMKSIIRRALARLKECLDPDDVNA
jgi:RNA polymerase sigma-70 factor (ECF subfamily)